MTRKQTFEIVPPSWTWTLQTLYALAPQTNKTGRTSAALVMRQAGQLLDVLSNDVLPALRDAQRIIGDSAVNDTPENDMYNRINDVLDSVQRANDINNDQN